MSRKKPTSRTRMQLKEVTKPFVPALRIMSNHIYNTSNDEALIKELSFKGYKMKAGELADDYGRVFEIQIHAVLAKDKMIKKSEIQQIRGRIKPTVWLKTIVSHIMNWANNQK